MTLSYECPICREDVVPGSRKVVQPCKCQTYVHPKCLNVWIDQKRNTDRNPRQCEVCLVQYQYKTVKTINMDTVYTCSRQTFLWVMIVLAYLIGILICLSVVYCYSTLDVYNSGWKIAGKVLVYIFPFGMVITTALLGYGATVIPTIYSYFPRYQEIHFTEYNWKDIFIVLSVHYLVELLYGILFFIIQVVGVMFLQIFRGEKVFHKFRPTAGTFGVGVGMSIAIGLMLCLIGYPTIVLCKRCIEKCGKCCKWLGEVCIKEEEVLTNYQDSSHSSGNHRFVKKIEPC